MLLWSLFMGKKVNVWYIVLAVAAVGLYLLNKSGDSPFTGLTSQRGLFGTTQGTTDIGAAAG
jgi:hypothetical protein